MSILLSGGWVVGAIFALSLLAWSLIINRLVSIGPETKVSGKWEQSIFNSLAQRDTQTAAVLCRQRSGAIAKIVAASLTMHTAGLDLTKKRATELVRQETVYLWRHFKLIAIIGAVLPLLGLLGTILGITVTLSALTLSPGAETSAAMAGGISQALITTQAGLVTALPIVLIHGWMSSRVRFCISESTRVIKRVEVLLRMEEHRV
ncbi:MAG: MotA/TolQ/ExbB proton channel family protein [Pontiellaceae bacterium]|nr:MotA/TolQ/ExbB proton channel family protein [Pontiellaceae bacterium]